MTDSEGPENLSIVEETSDGHDDGISLPESPRVSKESLMAAMDQLIGRNYPSESNGSVELNPYKNGVAPEAMAEGLTGNSATQNMPHGLSGDPLVPPTLPDFSPTTESLSIHENVVEKSNPADFAFAGWRGCLESITHGKNFKRTHCLQRVPPSLVLWGCHLSQAQSLHFSFQICHLLQSLRHGPSTSGMMRLIQPGSRTKKSTTDTIAQRLDERHFNSRYNIPTGKLAVNQKSNPENLHRHNGDVSLSPYHPSRIRLPLILAEVEYTGIRYGGRIAPLIQRLINRPQAL